MTWAPRNKSEDEDEDEGDAARNKEESPDKAQDGTETSAEDEGERGRGRCEGSRSLLPRRAVVGADTTHLPRGARAYESGYTASFRACRGIWLGESLGTAEMLGCA